MKNKTETQIIEVKTLFEIEPMTTLKEGARYIIQGAAGRHILLDFTGVRLNGPNRKRLVLLAEAFDDCGAAIHRMYDNDSTSKVVREFRAIRRELDQRTVRIAYGEQLVDTLNQVKTTREALELLNDPEDGEVKCIRFKTKAEKQAYLLALSDSDGWFNNQTLVLFGGAVERASRKLSVEEV